MMKNHQMVVTQIVNTGIRVAQGVFAGSKVFSRYESKVYTKLYGTARGRGVRHGLTAGGIAGSLINDFSGEQDSALPKKSFKRNVFTSSKSYKARGRFKRNCRCRKY